MLHLNSHTSPCPDCSVCSKRFTASLGFACNKCSDNAAGGIALAVAMVVVFLLASVAFLSYMLSGEMEGVNQGIAARVTRFIPLQSVKIVIVVWQILTQVSRTATVFRCGRLRKSRSNKKNVWSGYARKRVHIFSPKTVLYFYCCLFLYETVEQTDKARYVRHADTGQRRGAFRAG